MTPVRPALFSPLCSANRHRACAQGLDTLCRIKESAKPVFEWIHQRRHAIVAGTGLALGLVIVAAGEAVNFIPLAILMIGLGSLGMLRQHLAKKAHKQAEERLDKLQKSLNDFKAKLPAANRNTQTIAEIEAFANETAAEASKFAKSLKDNYAYDAKRFQKCLEPNLAKLEFYKNRVRALRDIPETRNELEWTQHAYRNSAKLFMAQIQLEAQYSLYKESKWVKALGKRAARA